MAMHIPDLSRRRVLQTGLGATALFLPVPYASVWAQSAGASKLLRLPKMALVLGNSKYVNVPTLLNPGNDARAISDLLRERGFDVTVNFDATRDEMAAAIRTYVQTLAARKAVGLFYFAGHGVQLSWRNYLVPVDAMVRTPEDIPRTCIDLNSLMEGISKASNPMNVLILDACRENPFSAEVRGEGRTLGVTDAQGSVPGTAQKPPASGGARGLSQMDAPHSTLLAYATAPGNVASDGEGANGLYTENLLREMRVPDAKIEDVFKRVRLHVRRSTNGQQIPWESTSLEEDFYFVPPAELKKVSDAEAARAFELELALWESIKHSNEPGPLEDYLRRYPGGKFSELAQFQLDRVLAAQGEKKIEIASQQNNPFTAGTARANTHFQIGDSYTGRRIDLLTRLQERSGTLTVTGITDSEIIYNKGGRIEDYLGNVRKLPNGMTATGSQVFLPEYSVGKRWSTTYRGIRRDGTPDEWNMNYRVVGKEKITVPAGTFDAFRVEGTGYIRGNGTLLDHKYWVAPGIVRRPIAQEHMNRLRGGVLIDNDRVEMVSYRQS
jgi:uncharacterized caspase-like protein